MNVKKDVYEKCKQMIEREINGNKFKINDNKRKINVLAKEQRILKAQLGKLYEMLKDFK